MKKEKKYSEAIQEIEGIITEIENETIDVDLLTEKVRTAVGLIKLCKSRLRSTEEELENVLKEFEKPDEPDKPDESGKNPKRKTQAEEKNSLFT
ncbi:MAG: exodeoxyribonuclease VII small subunit [Nitrospirae bacterium]|nr:exodeoxyribonuclease VII small subunit [Nitrospirota bacterium]MBF0534940.1 exodeoxyribonuclease VII small subunit [Nitrospirota bacterium]MBF0617209.1 exodeoxyribonuclease VII small subunit [Nitrospirota bacterium]